MATNTLDTTQIKAFLNNVTAQATGAADISAFEGESFATVAQTALKTGYDNLLGAVSQVLSATLFATRPYTRKFQGLEADSIRFGNIVRKINYIDGEFEDNEFLPITDRVSVDQQKPVKPNVVQTNFYGNNAYSIPYTIFREQLLTAFNNEEELGSFVSGQIQNVSDRAEQKHETLARSIITNLATGISAIGNKNQVVHLLTEYNALTGKTLTAQTMYAPENFPSFMRWIYARIAGVSAMLTERTVMYHQNLTGKNIPRHTPESYQRLFMYTPIMYEIQANALAETYRDYDIFKPNVTERVNFWQSPKDPAKMIAKPTYMDVDGTLKKPAKDVTLNNVFAVLVDRDAVGYTITDYHSSTAPYNGAGEYQNFFMKFVDRYWNDFTENAVLFLLD